MPFFLYRSSWPLIWQRGVLPWQWKYRSRHILCLRLALCLTNVLCFNCVVPALPANFMFPTCTVKCHIPCPSHTHISLLPPIPDSRIFDSPLPCTSVKKKKKNTGEFTGCTLSQILVTKCSHLVAVWSPANSIIKPGCQFDRHRDSTSFAAQYYVYCNFCSFFNTRPWGQAKSYTSRDCIAWI